MQMNRLFEIVYILLSQKNQKTVTARELAERFAVSQRTIYRDIDALSFAGVPIYTNKGKGGGIGLLPDFVLDKSLLNESEQNEILSALQGLSVVKTEETHHVLKKLGTIFNRSVVNWIEVDFSDWTIQNGETFRLLKTAILEKRVARFAYFNARGETANRRIEPIQLLFKSKSWYLKGYCLDNNDIRLFKLTRIKNPAVAEETFVERDLLKTHEHSPESPEYAGQVITVKLKISPKMTYRVHDEFNENQVEKNSDGSYTVTATWPEDDWMYGFILSFGEHIEVLHPAHVREIIVEKFQKALDKYR
jgi:Predicted transcriptional regulator